MSFMDKLHHEFIDIIEWLDDSNDTLVYRFPRYENSIKNGAKLTVRQSQVAVFANSGQIADVFQSGMYTLTTPNLPILSTLQGWKYDFESPFKAEVYFVSTRQFTDLKWGTKNPIMLRDPEFGPLRLRAFGTYVIQVNDPVKLIQQVAGTAGTFTTEQIDEQLRDLIVTRFADVLANSQIAALDLAANYGKLGEMLTARIQSEFGNYGISIPKLLIENVSLPPEVEEALDKRTSMGVIGNLNAYAQYQAATAMTEAAQNPNGMAGGGFGFGMGVAMAGQAGAAMAPAAGVGAPGAGAGAPPPVPQAVTFFVAHEGQQTGPFDAATLQQMAHGGQLTRETLVWSAGMAQWTPAGQVPALAPLFGQTPPPLA